MNKISKLECLSQLNMFLVYLREPVAVEDRPIESLLFVNVGKVFESNHVDVFICPPSLFITYQPGKKGLRQTTLSPLCHSLSICAMHLLNGIKKDKSRIVTSGGKIPSLRNLPSPVLEKTESFMGPDADEPLNRQGLKGPQGLEDAPHPAGHLSG